MTRAPDRTAESEDWDVAVLTVEFRDWDARDLSDAAMILEIYRLNAADSVKEQ